jgi:fatty-acyl-CoA synthase
MSRHTIDKIIRDRARITPGRVAIEEQGRTWTYADLDARSDELARGLSHGERVSTLTGNSGEHVALMFACAKTGAILHPISWRLAPAEVAFQLDDAEPALFLIEDEYRQLGEAALALAGVRPALEVGDSHAAPGRPASDDDPLLLIYTSGTTGKPKGALLTHANCFWTNLSFELATGIRPDDVTLQVLPQFHCGGWNVQSILAWWKGAKVILERGFDPARALDVIERARVTTLMETAAPRTRSSLPEPIRGTALTS